MSFQEIILLPQTLRLCCILSLKFISGFATELVVFFFVKDGGCIEIASIEEHLNHSLAEKKALNSSLKLLLAYKQKLITTKMLLITIQKSYFLWFNKLYLKS